MADEEYDDQKAVQDDATEVSRAQTAINDIKAAISSNNAANALRTAAQTFPLNIKGEALRKQIVDTWSQILPLVPATDALVNDLTPESRSNVMKYVYKVMVSGDKKVCDAALSWHAALTKKDGVGIINRVLVERRV